MKLFKENKKRFTELLTFAVIVILIYKLIDMLPWSGDGIAFIIGVATPIIAGFILAFILYIPAQKFEDLFKKTKGFFCKHARGLSVLLTYILFVVVIGLLIYAILPIFIENVMNLAKDIPNYGDRVTEFLSRFADEDGRLFNMDIQKLMSEDVPAAIISFFNVERISDIIGGAYAVGSAIITTVLSFIISVYMLLDRDGLIAVCGKVFSIGMSGATVHKVRKYLRKISDIFYSYIYSQLLDSLLVAVVCGIAFSIIGIQYAIFFALLIGLCNLIPYFGAIIGGVVISLVTWATGGFVMALITAIVIVVVMQIDGNLLQPRIVGKTVGIRPIYVLIAITLGGGFFGFLGVLLGVPTIATIRMMLIDYIALTARRRATESSKNAE